ncbi:hypothetical protein [Streptomyces sp. NPDC046727]|uniref:hypothetical protein n=1 Tax=Streptomyces sp. NPDC046727 TaxID=3155373 RepID=UPI0033C60307
MSENSPVLPGFIQDHDSGQQTLRVWCRWCCIWHEHGHTATPAGDTTDRTAHCFAPDSPYKDTGYNILVRSTPFSAAQTMVRKASVTQERSIRAGRITRTVQQLRGQAPPAG